MKERINLLVADILDNLNDLKKIESEYDLIIRSIKGGSPDNMHKIALGYCLHNFFNICENMFLNIARCFENAIDQRESSLEFHMKN